VFFVFSVCSVVIFGMFSETADFYDLIYSFKDYASEAAKIRETISRVRPGEKTVLDVACGTAEHAKILSGEFVIDGIDLEPRFVEIARAKNPAGSYRVGDMRSFEMGKRYDVVMCLLSSIGYLLTGEEIVSALKCFAMHLEPGGVVLVEPWILPENYVVGRPHMVVVDKPDVKICRMNVSERVGDVSVLRFYYLIATGEGVRRVEEVHRLAMVPVERILGYFESAGLRCEFDSVGLFGRGLFVGRVG
jgi:SAM-dependent methyltransferase